MMIWMSSTRMLWIRREAQREMCDQSCLLVDLSCGNWQNMYSVYIYIWLYMCICSYIISNYIHTYSPSMKFLLCRFSSLYLLWNRNARRLQVATRFERFQTQPPTAKSQLPHCWCLEMSQAWALRNFLVASTETWRVKPWFFDVKQRHSGLQPQDCMFAP